MACIGSLLYHAQAAQAAHAAQQAALVSGGGAVG
jgi:hypothetical protein